MCPILFGGFMNKEEKREYMKEYRLNNKEKIKEYDKKYRENNKEKRKEKNKQYREKHHEKELKRKRLYYRNNLEKIKEDSKQYYNKNSKEMQERMYQWRKNNPGYMYQWRKNNHRTDLKFNLNDRMRRAINHSLKGNKNGRHWETLVGYTLDDLVKRLKKTMPEGYGWQDYLKGKLHIDHIIPVSVFNFDKPEDIDFQNCWALNNLQLLPARENIIKSNKLDNPFQPALKIYSEVIKYE